MTIAPPAVPIVLVLTSVPNIIVISVVITMFNTFLTFSLYICNICYKQCRHYTRHFIWPHSRHHSLQHVLSHSCFHILRRSSLQSPVAYCTCLHITNVSTTASTLILTILVTKVVPFVVTAVVLTIVTFVVSLVAIFRDIRLPIHQYYRPSLIVSCRESKRYPPLASVSATAVATFRVTAIRNFILMCIVAVNVRFISPLSQCSFTPSIALWLTHSTLILSSLLATLLTSTPFRFFS